MQETHEFEKPDNAEELEYLGLEGLAHILRQDTNAKARGYAARLMGKIQNPIAVQQLVLSLADPDKSVRAQATQALISIGKTAVEPLAVAMKEPQWQTRYRAAEALGRIADEKAVKPLIQGLRDDRDHVRYMAAKGLRDFGNSDAIDPMIILLNDENRYVRMMAVRALGVIGGEKADAALGQLFAREEDEQIRTTIKEILE